MTPTQPTATTTEARVTEAAAILHKKFGVQCGMTELEMWIPIARAALSIAPSEGGVPGMVLAAKDLLASLDPDALNPEQFNAWHALDASLLASSTGKETP